MLDKKMLKKAEKIIRGFFEKMTLDVDLKLTGSNDSLVLELKTENPQFLIGEHGRTLVELQRLLGMLLRKRLALPAVAAGEGRGEAIHLKIDINQYREGRERYLRELVRGLADRVALERREKTLSHLSSYERRVVHLELSARGDVKTESVGEEPNRMLVIKPA